MSKSYNVGINVSNANRTLLENEIKQCLDHQRMWHSRLCDVYVGIHQIDSIDDIPGPIREVFDALVANDCYLETTVEKLEEHDLTQLELTGFPKVTELVNGIKK